MAEIRTINNGDEAVLDIGSGPLYDDTGPVKIDSSYGPRATISYQDDTSIDQWCAIRVIEYRYRPEQIKNNERVVCDIMLPMPLQLQTGYNQQWTELDDLSALISQMANETGKGVQDILNDPKGFLKEFGETASSAFMGNTSDLLKNIALNPTAAAAIGGIVGGGLVGAATGTEGGVAAGAAAGATIAQATSRAVGTIGGLAANKYQTVTFEKPQLRQHQFSWNLIARSQEQAKRIKRIIYKLKYHSSPDQRGGRAFGFFKYPELFALHFDGAEGSTGA